MIGKNVIIIGAILLYTIKINAQDYLEGFRILTNSSLYTIDTIADSVFNGIPPTVTNDKSENLLPVQENELTNNYPDIFNFVDSCYTFKKNTGREKQVCNKDHIGKPGRVSYTIKGQYCNYVLFYYTGFEHREYISVSIEDGLSFSTLGHPKAFDCRYIYSCDKYYGELEITLIDIVTDQMITLIYNGWEMLEYKFNAGCYYFKISKNNKIETIKVVLG